MVARSMVICLRVPLRGEDANLLDTLRDEPKASVRLEVPEAWCYRIKRPGPPGGWKRATLASLRPTLFPEPLEALEWDEDLADDGTWRVWALPRVRLEKALGEAAEVIWTPGRPVRVHPSGEAPEADLAGFPNLAPVLHRPRRIPWGRIRRQAFRLGPVLAVVLALGLGGVRTRGAWSTLQASLREGEQSVQRLERDVQGDRLLLTVLQSQSSNGQKDPAWLVDLDALTRLLPEDTRLASLRWSPEGAQVDLLTPHPELIQEILDASPEFNGVHLVGNLDRQGDLSRLTLQIQREAGR